MVNILLRTFVFCFVYCIVYNCKYCFVSCARIIGVFNLKIVSMSDFNTCLIAKKYTSDTFSNKPMTACWQRFIYGSILRFVYRLLFFSCEYIQVQLNIESILNTFGQNHSPQRHLHSF